MKEYRDFSSWLKECFPFKVQKISVDAGFSCPNRDGKLSFGGCTFCDNETFVPSYCNNSKRSISLTVSEQIAEGKNFFARKYPSMKYLAYFQAYSNTYAPLPQLKSLYEEALQDEDVVGIVIGTRPDCISEELLDYLEELSKRFFVLVEYGVESVKNSTLKSINRGHDFECSLYAVRETARRGIKVGVHIILGLPGDDDDTTIPGIKQLYDSGMTLLKLHQLQIIRSTKMAEEFEKHPFPLYTVNQYIDVIIRYITALPKDIVYDRFTSQSPPGKVVAPCWNIKNFEFANKLDISLKDALSHQ